MRWRFREFEAEELAADLVKRAEEKAAARKVA
jgi:hypothetical protein